MKTANLLGIVGTDVPIEEIQKLVPPYKVGYKKYVLAADLFYPLFCRSWVSTGIPSLLTITAVFCITRIYDHW